MPVAIKFFLGLTRAVENYKCYYLEPLYIRPYLSLAIQLSFVFIILSCSVVFYSAPWLLRPLLGLFGLQ